MNQLRIALLGQPQLFFEEKPLHESLLQKSQALLYYLAAEGETQPRDLLAGLLWSEMPQENARVNLRTALARLRGAVGDLVTATRTHVTLHEGYWCDLVAFDRPKTDLQTLQTSIAHYRDDFLTGFAPPDAILFEEWTILQRERLRQQMYNKTLSLVDLLADTERFSDAIVQARRLLVLDNLREIGHRKLIDLLARNGNRIAALTQFEQLRVLLDEELGVEPSAQSLALVARLREEPSPPNPLSLRERGSKNHSTQLHNFPAIASSFHGRGEEIAQIVEMFKQPDCRLVTLVGMGGIGKTRLAIEAVQEVAESVQSCWFVPLAAVSDREGIVNALVQTLGLYLSDRKPREEQLFTYLRTKELLFVLDNFEQLTDEVAILSEMLRRCPQMKLLVTSRARLKLYEEWMLPIVGLQVAAPQSAATSEAVQLFVQRARQQDIRFALAEQQSAVLAICERVEGLPLGIELAAAWTGMLSCQEIASELAELTMPLANLPARQRSLQAVFDYSWQLLSDEERRTLAQLTVFRGGFSADAARAITQCSRQTLQSLVEKSLVQFGEGRFDLHAMVRELAAHHLTERSALQAKHRAWYADYVLQATPHLINAEQTTTHNRLRQDEANLLLAWRNVNEQRELANFEKMLDGMSFYFMTGGRYREGHEWIKDSHHWLTQVGARDHLIGRTLIRTAVLWQHANHGATEPDAMLQRGLSLVGDDVKEQGRAHFGLGYSGMFHGAYEAAIANLQQAIVCAEAVDDQVTLGDSLQSLAYLLTRRGERDSAMQLAERAVALQRAIGGLAVASSLTTLGNLYNNASRHDEAKAIFEEVLERTQAVNHLVGIASALTGLFVTAYRQGDLEAATRYGEQSLAVYREAGDLWGVAVGQHNMGALSAERGDDRGAMRFYRQSAETYEQINAHSTGLANSLAAWGKMLVKLGEFAEAESVLKRALRLAQQLDSPRFVGKALVYFAQLAAAEGRSADAATILGHALEIDALTTEVREEALETAKHIELITAVDQSRDDLITTLLA